MGDLIRFPVRPGFEPSLPKLLAARAIGVSDRTLERWTAQGCPHHRTPEGFLRYTPSKVRSWRNEQDERIGDDAA